MAARLATYLAHRYSATTCLRARWVLRPAVVENCRRHTDLPFRLDQGMDYCLPRQIRRYRPIRGFYAQRGQLVAGRMCEPVDAEITDFYVVRLAVFFG